MSDILNRLHLRHCDEAGWRYNVIMAWKTSSVMEEKLRFVFEYERDEQTMAELCACFGICRDTGYVWLRRYRQYGVGSLLELNRAAKRHPNQTCAQNEQAVIELRQAHMRWGPRKLKRILERDQPGRGWPATSTVGEIVKRAGLVVARKKRRRTEPYTEPLAHAVESNRVWCADFKGWFRSGDGTRIDPLTITDACSRYLLRCQAVEKTDTERVRAIFEAAFREYGLPGAIRTDNGAPFASSAVGGLSRLAVWWIKLGIVPERIQAGHPEQNGRHERMHRTLKQDLRPAQDWRGQQRELDRFREEYNQVRPHEALGMQTPASVYEPSPREYPHRLPEVEYPDTMLVRTVKSHGHFRWKRHDVFLSEVLWGERVGLLPVDDDRFTVYFAHLPVARFDARSCKIAPMSGTGPAKHALSGPGQACPGPESKNKNLPDMEKVSEMCPV
jgi:transposase InsO family protein